MSEWRDIETAPKDGTRVLLYRPGWNEDRVVGYWDITWERWGVVLGHGGAVGVTMWQPLPEPPRG